MNKKKIVLKDRNEKWVDGFKEAYESDQYQQIFLAGGTAHFIAAFNVLDMFKTRWIRHKPYER